MKGLRDAVRPLGSAACMLAVIGCGGRQAAGARVDPGSPAYEVHAIRYGTLAQFPVASLVAGADPARPMDIALMVWVIRDPGRDRVGLLGAGFYRDKVINPWKPGDFVRPPAAPPPLGGPPGP